MTEQASSIPYAEYLPLREEQLWRELKQMAPSAPAKVRELQGILKVKEAMNIGTASTEPGPYSGIKNAKAAIQAHLHHTPPFTLTRDELAAEVLRGGWGAFLNRRALNVRDSIRTQITAGDILEVDKRLGLPDKKQTR